MKLHTHVRLHPFNTQFFQPVTDCWVSKMLATHPETIIPKSIVSVRNVTSWTSSAEKLCLDRLSCRLDVIFQITSDRLKGDKFWFKHEANRSDQVISNQMHFWRIWVLKSNGMRTTSWSGSLFCPGRVTEPLHNITCHTGTTSTKQQSAKAPAKTEAKTNMAARKHMSFCTGSAFRVQVWESDRSSHTIPNYEADSVPSVRWLQCILFLVNDLEHAGTAGTTLVALHSAKLLLWKAFDFPSPKIQGLRHACR